MLMRNPSLLTRDRTHIPVLEGRFLTAGPPGKPLQSLLSKPLLSGSLAVMTNQGVGGHSQHQTRRPGHRAPASPPCLTLEALRSQTWVRLYLGMWDETAFTHVLRGQPPACRRHVPP